MTAEKKQLYFNIANRSKMPFQVFIGGRGTGKTYSAMQLLSQSTGKFIYMRRTGKEIDACGTDFGNPFKAVNPTLSNPIIPLTGKKMGDSATGTPFFYKETEGEMKCVGYGIALSTFAGMRSIDLSDVEITVFDEFIPEAHVKKMRGEGPAVLNFYETVNRNREIQGRSPMRLILMANALSLANPILEEFGIVNELQNMIQSGELRRTIPERGIYIERVGRVQITDLKRDTALYKMANKDFTDDALSADFLTADLSTIEKNVNLREYKPSFRFGNLVCFNRGDELYFAQSTVDCPINYPESSGYKLRAMYAPKYRISRAFNRIKFDNYMTQVYMDNIMNWVE